MRLRLPVCLLALVLVMPGTAALATTEAVTAAAGAQDSADTLAGQVLVTFRSAKTHGRAPGAYGRPAARGSQSQPGRAQAERVARDHGLSVLDGWPMPSLGVDCFVMQLPPGQARTQVVQALAADPRVESAQPMQEFRVLAAADPLLPTQPVATAWHLRELHLAATGRGIDVASVDTGVLAGHPDLRGRLAQARNFVPGQDFVAEAHGTAVASILAARADDGIGIAGIAPDARLLALRACWQLATGGARCSSYSLAQALQYALVERVRVINLSLTGPEDALLGRLLDVATREGIVTVAAVDAASADGGFPASHPGVLPVAADGDPAVRADAIRAPGKGIPAANVSGGWSLVSGSSFAAAQVSGLVALLLELSPRLGPAALQSALAPRPGDVALDACAALARAGASCSCNCAANARTAARASD